jgi:uncharacterized membrane protein YvbJ
MNCLRCGHKNNATVAYCAKCGGKLDLTADEIAEALVQKAQDERASNTEFYARQALFFAVILFMLSITIFVLSLGAQTDSYAVPSIVDKTRYIEVQYNVMNRLDLPKGLIPYQEKR